MKIMFCLGSMTKGGAERVIANLSNDLVNKYDISIVVTPPDKPMYELDKRITYYTLDSTKLKKGVFARTIHRVIKLRKTIKKYNPDIIVSLLPEPTFRIMIAKIGLHKKAIISVRNDPNVEYNTMTKKILMKLLYSRANGFIFQTNDAKKYFSKKIQKKSAVIPNPINDSFICKPYDKKREKIIVSVGRLTKQKNQKLLIDSFYEVHKKYDDYILKIYGSGELKDDLENQIEKLGLKKSAFLMGEVDDIKEEIYKSCLFVLTSDYEGMPNALLEAMALGIPCISTNCPIGGPKSLINNYDNGILVEVNDKNKIVDAMIKIIRDDKFAKKIGDNANKICNELNSTIINDKWEKYILKVIGDDINV